MKSTLHNGDFHPWLPSAAWKPNHPASQVKKGQNGTQPLHHNRQQRTTFPDLYRSQLARSFPPTRHCTNLDALIWRQNHKNIKVYGYVTLENHMHCILQSPDLGQQVYDFKAFTAKEILRYLEQNKAHNILEQFSFFKKSHKTDSNYQLWEEGSHPQLIQNEEILRQKLDYIHLNPVTRL